MTALFTAATRRLLTLAAIMLLVGVVDAREGGLRNADFAEAAANGAHVG